MEKLKKCSLRISIVIYFAVALVMAQMIYSIIGSVIDKILISLVSPRPDELLFSGKTYISFFRGSLPLESSKISNKKLFWLLKWIKDMLPVFIYGIGIISAAIIFYKKRLELPLKKLGQGIEKITQQDLEFSLATDSEDEIGKLSNAFEKMRSELSTTFKRSWKEREQQELLFKALIHDIRTPLTIIEGNNEVALLFLEEGNNEKIKESLELSKEAVERIKAYTTTLQKMKDVKNWKIDKKSVFLKSLQEKVQNEYIVLCEKMCKKLEVICTNETTQVDEEMVRLILDKLIENGLRFSKSKVWVYMKVVSDKLSITVEDDGQGFDDEALSRGVEMFFSKDKEVGHMGLGLAIVNNVLECAHGKIICENREEGGARIRILI